MWMIPLSVTLEVKRTRSGWSVVLRVQLLT